MMLSKREEELVARVSRQAQGMDRVWLNRYLDKLLRSGGESWLEPGRAMSLDCKGAVISVIRAAIASKEG